MDKETEAIVTEVRALLANLRARGIPDDQIDNLIGEPEEGRIQMDKRGVGMFFRDVERNGFNPITKEAVPCIRRVLHLEEELPLGEEYSDFIKGIIRNY